MASTRIIRIVLLVLACSSCCFQVSTLSNQTRIEIASNLFNHLNLYLRDFHYKFYGDALSKVKPLLLIGNREDQLCFEILNQTLSAPLDYPWSAQLLDASGSLISPGSLAGTVTSFGDFDSCLAIQDKYKSHRFYGQYCFATLHLPFHLPTDPSPRPIEYLNYTKKQSWPQSTLIRWIESDPRFPIARALCLPSVCRAEFIHRIVLESFEPLKTLRFNISFCQSVNSNQGRPIWLSSHLTIWLIAGSVLSLVLIASLVDLVSDVTGKANAWLACFSLFTNGPALFSVRRSAGSLAWIDGLRVILTIVVLISHVSINHPVLQLSVLSPYTHFPDDYHRQSQKLIYRYLVNSTFAIKSYFLISGFLLTLSYFKKQYLPNLITYFLHRWLRFTPTFLGYVAFTLLLSYIGSGPLFHSKLIEPYVQPCLDYLPSHLLYINNWLDFRHMCGFHTWYLSADLQLYLLAYLILWLVLRRKSLAYFIITLFITISYLIILVIFAAKIQGIPFFISALYPQLPIANQGYFYYWTATYNHLEAYFIGVALGIIVGKRIILKIPLSAIRFLLNIAFFTLLCLPFTFPWFLKGESTRSLSDLVQSYSWFDASILTSAHAMWIITLAWIFYAASTYKVSNLELRILSAPIFAPLARISFCVYLVHVPLTWFNVHQARNAQIRNEFGVAQFTQMTLFNSFFVAILLHLFFEAPFTRLSVLWFSSSRNPGSEYKTRQDDAIKQTSIL